MLNLNNFKSESPEENVLYFINDDDFAKFCINPELRVKEIINQNGQESYVTYYDFSDQYLNALNSGMYFCVQDTNSHVNKDGFLGYRDTTMKIDNVKRYYDED